MYLSKIGFAPTTKKEKTTKGLGFGYRATVQHLVKGSVSALSAVSTQQPQGAELLWKAPRGTATPQQGLRSA